MSGSRPNSISAAVFSQQLNVDKTIDENKLKYERLDEVNKPNHNYQTPSKLITADDNIAECFNETKCDFQVQKFERMQSNYLQLATEETTPYLTLFSDEPEKYEELPESDDLPYEELPESDRLPYATLQSGYSGLYRSYDARLSPPPLTLRTIHAQADSSKLQLKRPQVCKYIQRVLTVHTLCCSRQKMKYQLKRN